MKGCLTILVFALWMGIVIWLPTVIFDGVNEIGICACYASMGFIFGALSAESNKDSWKSHFPVTVGHLWILILYAVIAMFIIGFKKNIDYESMKQLGRSISYYAALPIVSFLIEGIADPWHKQ